MAARHRNSHGATAAIATEPHSPTVLEAKISDAKAGHLGVTLTTAEHNLGALVEAAHPSDLVALAGLKAGHVITAINSTAVTDHEQALSLMLAAEGSLTISYLTADDAAIEAKAAKAKYELSSPKRSLGMIVIVFIVIALGAIYFLINNDAVLKMLQPSPPANTNIPPPRTPLDPFDKELKKTELLNGIVSFVEKYPHMETLLGTYVPAPSKPEILYARVR